MFSASISKTLVPFHAIIKKLSILSFLIFLFPSITFTQKVNVDSLIQLLETDLDTESRINTLLHLSRVYTHTNPGKEAEYLNQALKSAKGNESLEIKVQENLAYNFYRNRQLDSVIIICQRILPYYQKISDIGRIIYCYKLMGHVNKAKRDLDAAINYYNKGLEITKEDDLDRAILYLSLSNVQEMKGLWEVALENCFKAMKIAEAIKNDEILGGIKNSIGTLYNKQADYEKALINFKEAVDLSLKSGNINAATAFKINLANTYLFLENEEEALKTYEEVLEASEKINHTPYILRAKSYLANFYARADSDKYQPLLADLDSMVSQLGYDALPQYYQAKIHHFEKNGQFKSALEMAYKFHENSVKTNSIEQKSRATEYLAELNRQVGNLEEAYDYYVEYKVLSDSVSNEKRLSEIKLQEAQYNFDKEQLALEKTHQAESAAQKRFNIWASIFSGLLLILSFVLFRVAQGRQKLSKELLKKNQELETLNESKTRFFADVSHELKTPLTLIINPLQKLKKRKTLIEEDKYLIQTAEKNSLELLDRTNQVLELTKFEMDKVAINYSVVQFYPFLKKILANFESLVQSRSIDFQIEYQVKEDLNIQTDDYKLQTILKNLISNALKFTHPDDLLKITVTENKDTLEIQVHDTGRGIHINDIPYVFDRYFQSKSPKAISEGGTGIGLAVCKEYAKLLGGDISVQSVFGESTTFTVSLPIIVADTSSSSVNPTPSIPITKNIKLTPPNTNQHLPTILLVEDNLDMQAYLQFTLQTNYNVIIAGNGQEGLKVLETQAHQVQLIISDVMMPVMDGYEFLENLKKNEQFAAIPIIMLTALSDSKHKLKGLRTGIDDYLTKPFVDEELIARIDNLLANVEEKQSFQMTELIGESATNGGTAFNDPSTESARQTISVQDLEWLENLENIVKENISDNSYTVDKLAVHLMMSRTVMYRKIKTLTGITPNNYINQVRYEQARYYLENKQFSNIKTVAYHVGFKDERYFARNFKKRYGKYPSEYRG